MDVSVIIVNYNTKQLLNECLGTVYKQTKGIRFEVIVVDNASNDGSERFITEHYPQVHWINSGDNHGFGRANNLGAKFATGKYLFLLNSDTLLLNNAIKEFYDYAEAHSDERIGVLGCWLLDKDRKPNNSYGRFPSPRSEMQYLLRWTCRKYILPQSGSNDVDYIIGADMFIRKDVFDSFGGFDSQFFMYYEETDLQYRMARNGYVRRVISTPQIIHLEGGSFAQKGLTFNRFMMAQRSYKYYISKHYNGIKYIAFRLFLCLIRSTVLFQQGWTGKERLKGFLSSFTS